jgi:hypothetical protein
MERPYTEQIKDGYIIREFSDKTTSMEFVWHRDRNDRLIEPLHETDWKFQLDNEVPIELNRIFIKAGTYHRLIKGTGKLKLKIKE